VVLDQVVDTDQVIHNSHHDRQLLDTGNDGDQLSCASNTRRPVTDNLQLNPKYIYTKNLIPISI
jgi:hypothetical protein